MVSVVPLGSQGLEVSQQGLGFHGPPAPVRGKHAVPPAPEQDMIDFIRNTVDRGVTFLDTDNAHEMLVGKAIKGIREKVQLATTITVRDDLKHVRAACEDSLKRLCVDYIDLCYLHRMDTDIPIEACVGAMKELVKEGKVKYLGLSEASESDIRRAHAVHPITAISQKLLDFVVHKRQPSLSELGIGITVKDNYLAKWANDSKEKLSESPESKAGGPEAVGMPEKLEQLAREMAEKKMKKCSPNVIMQAWIIHNYGISILNVNPLAMTKEQLEQTTMDDLTVKLTDEEIAQLEAAAAAEDAAPSEFERHDRHMVMDKPPYRG
jgi:aryl-alcohol dehydrogenase-like predicted oxidoreductase